MRKDSRLLWRLLPLVCLLFALGRFAAAEPISADISGPAWVDPRGGHLQRDHRALERCWQEGVDRSVLTRQQSAAHLFARDYITNMGYTWYSAWRGKLGLGIQAAARR